MWLNLGLFAIALFAFFMQGYIILQSLVSWWRGEAGVSWVIIHQPLLLFFSYIYYIYMLDREIMHYCSIDTMG
jgi:hypothetical protein